MVDVDVRLMDETQKRPRMATWADAELGVSESDPSVQRLSLTEVIYRMRHQNLEREADWLLDYISKFWQEIA